MKNCKAFLFPSIYEGFGIPPLEALSHGTKIIISNAACLPEIYGDCAYYIDPYDYEVDLEKLLKCEVKPPDECLSRYSWEKSAKILLSVINDHA
jgi:glycosyltransferase involved in cell wall biosynthesis